MKSIIIVYLFMCCCQCVYAQGRIGINTNSPQAILHVKDSSVLFSLATLPVSPGNPPASGAGLRMMWYPQKAAFRAGDAGETAWNRDSIGNYSFATGRATKAKGSASFAAGERTEALGVVSIAMGENSLATGPNSIAIGEHNTATDANSIAMGLNSHATGPSSVAIGRQTTASGSGAVALGYGNEASGLASTAAGYFSTSEGPYSATLGFSTHAIGQMALATGYDTEAEGIVSIAAGYRSKSIGSYSISAGFQTESVPYASLAIGRYNNNTFGTSTSWIPTDPVFIIGNGEDLNTRSNAFVVLKNGKTAINFDNPTAALSIKGYDGTENNHLHLEDNNSVESGKVFYTGDFFFKNSRVGGDFFFRNDANTNILSLFSTGNVTIVGTLTQNSDARLKKDIRPLESPLKKVTGLNGYHYHWKNASRDPGLQTGFTAQNVESVMPELVTTATDGAKSVNYIGIIPYLAEAIKELKEQNAQLKTEIEELKKQQLRR